jgi:hypothetical protein
MATATNPPRYLTTREAAEALGPLPADLHALLVEHKSALLGLLAAKLAASWNQTEADRLLAEARAPVGRGLGAGDAHPEGPH